MYLQAMQQAVTLQYMPGKNEPKMWAVKTFGGDEREICNSLLVKLMHMNKNGVQDQCTIYSAIASERIKGIYCLAYTSVMTFHWLSLEILVNRQFLRIWLPNDPELLAVA